MSTQHQKKWTLLSLISLLCFVGIALGIVTNQIWVFSFDQAITNWIRPVAAPSENTLFVVKGITTFGGVQMIVPLMLLLAAYLWFFKKNRGLALWLVLNIALGAGLLNVIAKHLFLRPRPSIEHFVVETGWSFPSGHSMGAMICYTSIAFVFIYLSHSKINQAITALLCATLIFSIGISRIYLGVHYPSDVLGGFALGFAWMALSIGLCHWWLQLFTSSSK